MGAQPLHQPLQTLLHFRGSRLCVDTGVPDRCGDVAFFAGVVFEVDDRDDVAIRALHAAWVADVPAVAVVAKNDFIGPGLSLVAGEHCAQPVGGVTPAVGERNAAVGELEGGSGVAAVVDVGLVEFVPAFALVG
jgi:hypothetical protein